MRLVDLQNQIANVLLNQQFGQASSNHGTATPSALNQAFQEEVREENETVQEGEETDEKDGIREEDENRNSRRELRMRRRAALEEEEEEQEKKRVKDGIHGNYLDVEG
ncbi:MAG: hypothetical protein P9L94_02890 [Candidatus Hinthialibacter antarcticus]|nr:hypothetical protein [Candidatus Hinthialibacter antarcticus]